MSHYGVIVDIITSVRVLPIWQERECIFSSNSVAHLYMQVVSFIDDACLDFEYFLVYL